MFAGVKCLLIFVFCILSFKVDAELIVTNIEPKPNYKLTKDINDIAQLYDKNFLRYPTWIAKRSVGWQDATPVTTQILLSSPRYNQIVIHTGKSEKANVFPPRRVDVYGVEGDKFKHIGSYVGVPLPDSKNHAIKINIIPGYELLKVVIHADGKYLMVDEVETFHESADKAIVHSDGAIVDNATDDSLKKLKLSIANKYLHDKAWFSNPCVLSVEKCPINVYRVDPWKDTYDSIDVGSYARSSLVSMSGNHNVSYFIENRSDEDRVVNVDVLNSSGYSLYELKTIITSSGKRIPDVISRAGRKIIMSAGSRKQIYISINEIRSAEVELVFRLENEDIFRESLHIYTLNSQVISKKYINLWVYSSQNPFLLNRDETIKDLISSGVNVSVIHPSKLKRYDQEFKWTYDDKRKLIEEIKKNSHSDIILLFTNWSKKYFDKYSHNRDSLINALTDWLGVVKQVVGENIKENQKWVLYPVDEPHGERFDFLLKISKLIKAIDSSILIYANPIYAKSDYMSSRDVRKLSEFIDIWQPSYELLTKIGKDEFEDFGEMFWLYQNPASPAKEANLSFYRSLGWKTWCVSANGVGFWSYADTGGSSSWDDFDGKRPDWSVVYELDEGPVSSRRWVSFKQGVDDYYFLKYMFGDRESNDNGLNNDLALIKYRIENNVCIDGDYQDLDGLRYELEMFAIKHSIEFD